MIIMQSVSYRDRSFSREVTRMDLDKNPMVLSEWDIGLPTSLINTSRVLESFSDCICLRSHWTQEDMLLL